MQSPTNFPANDKEVRYSEWVTSIRKDVECSFGMLKKRFRCLKLPFMWKDIHTIEHVFVTCCMMHNILLDNRMSLHGGWSYDEVVPPRFRDPVHPAVTMTANDDTDYMNLVNEFGGDDDDEVEVDGTYQQWRERYIDNLYYMWVRKKHKWPGPVEPNDSMRITVR